MRIGIIGAGLMGLALAQRLAAKGACVTLFERESHLGGLSTWQDYGPFRWDRFYHVILPFDTSLIGFMKDIGLEGRLRWSPSRTGLFVDGRRFSMSTTRELAQFPLIGWVGKARLALTVLRCLSIHDWRPLETITTEDWLIRLCGRRTYEQFWRPLLLAKLGEQHRRVSAVFIWSYIKRIFLARDAAAQREHVGHVAGGYRTVIARLEDLIRAAGGEIRSGVMVTAVRGDGQGGIRVDWNGSTTRFDKVVCTCPTDVMKRIATDELVSVDGAKRGVEYLGVVCVVLVTRRAMTPYYVLNIADRHVPFTGVIGMSTVVSTEETADLHVTYLPKYVLSDDPLLREDEAVIYRTFLAGARRIFPDLRDEDIVSWHVHRAGKVQPLQVLRYSELVPTVTTNHPDFFVLNSSQFVNNTLNNNEVIRSVNEFVRQYGDRFHASSHQEKAIAAMAGCAPRSMHDETVR